MSEADELLVERLPRARRVLRVAIVTDLSPASARLVEGLRGREHEIQLVRRPGVRLGLPSARPLVRLWSVSRPDVVYVLTQGPLGWSALGAARRLRLPAVAHFNVDFLGYRVGWLSRRVVSYLRKFHNRALWTLVPSETLRAELAALGFRNLRVVGGGADAESWDLRRIETLLEIAASLGSARSGELAGRPLAEGS